MNLGVHWVSWVYILKYGLISMLFCLFHINNTWSHDCISVGSYITLKDKKWAVSVEGYLGIGTLSAFAVDNNKDNKLLREIFNKVWSGNRQPQIITSKFVYKVRFLSPSRKLTHKFDFFLIETWRVKEFSQGTWRLRKSVQCHRNRRSNCIKLHRWQQFSWKYFAYTKRSKGPRIVV